MERSDTPLIAFYDFKKQTEILCDQCPGTRDFPASLGMAHETPVIRVTCPNHGLIVQFEIAPSWLTHYPGKPAPQDFPTAN